MGKPVAKAWTSGDMSSGGMVTARCNEQAQPLPLLGGRGQLSPGAGADLLALALQLAAGGEDVAPARRADRRGVAGAVEDGREGLDSPPVGALVGAARPRIERDQVDLGRDALHQLD